MSDIKKKHIDPRGFIVLLISIFIWCNFFLPLAVDSSHHILGVMIIGLFFGITIAQVNLISIWGAISTSPIVTRLPWSLLLTIGVWCSLALGFRFYDDSLGPDEIAMLGFMLIAGQAVSQIPLWIANRLFGYKLLSPARPIGEANVSAGQFSLKQLFIGTTIMAAAFTLIRLILPNELIRLNEIFFDSEFWAILVPVAVCNQMIVLPCVWGAFQKRFRLPGLIVTWTITVTGVTIAQYFVINGFSGSASWWHWENFVVLLTMNYVQCITVSGVLWLLARIGFRLAKPTTPPRENEKPLTHVA